MKIVTLIARLLLGLMFLVLGLNGFLGFLNLGPMPTGLAGQFMAALFVSRLPMANTRSALDNATRIGPIGTPSIWRPSRREPNYPREIVESLPAL